MYKKLFILLLALSLVFSMSGCGEKENSSFQLQKSSINITQSVNPEDFEKIGVTENTLAFIQGAFRQFYSCDETQKIENHTYFPDSFYTSDRLMEKVKKGEFELAFIQTMEEPALSDELEYTLVGLESLVILTAGDNDVSQITGKDLIGVLNGEITDWSELGGKDGKILLGDNGFWGTNFSLADLIYGQKIKANLTDSERALLFPYDNATLASAHGEQPADYVMAFIPYYSLAFSWSVDSSFYSDLKQISVDGSKIGHEQIQAGEGKVVKTYAVTKKNSSSKLSSDIISWLCKPSEDGIPEALLMNGGLGTADVNSSWGKILPADKF